MIAHWLLQPTNQPDCHFCFGDLILIASEFRQTVIGNVFQSEFAGGDGFVADVLHGCIDGLAKAS